MEITNEKLIQHLNDKISNCQNEIKANNDYVNQIYDYNDKHPLEKILQKNHTIMELQRVENRILNLSVDIEMNKMLIERLSK